MRIIHRDGTEARIDNGQFLLREYREARRVADLANERVKRCEERLLEHMEQNREKSIVLNQNGKRYTATYTQRTTNQINEKGLRKALTAKVYDSFCVKKLDRNKLQLAMSDGRIDPVVVATFVEQVPGAKYLTYREKDESEPEDL
jgi:hypothetical protein